MIANRRSRIAIIARAAAPVAVAAFAAAVLLRFPPAQYSFYPQCPVYAWLHLECPGCGTTRALAALLHGHIKEAFRLNTLTTTMLGPAIAYAIICYRRYLGAGPFRWPQLPSSGVYAMLVITVAFAIVRNLPLHLL